ncbi:unnamed protein product [Linum trigynum]|uniref:Uncharacterized protein n=1 Tax=Linum trigynum TaxID=586398 RepID=A0AAV2E180_9ROSI
MHTEQRMLNYPNGTPTTIAKNFPYWFKPFVCPRSLYDVPEKEEAGHGDPVYENQPYQQDVDISNFNVSESDLADLSRDDEAPTIVTEPVIRAIDGRAAAVEASDEEIEDDTLDDHHFTTNETKHPDGNDPSFSDEEEA